MPSLSATAPPGPSGLLARLRAFLREGHPLVQLWALLLLAVGWLLSPLCWWNDLVINLPLAWGFARLLQLWHGDWFGPGLVIGYWISNVAGVLLMQSGALTVFRDSTTPSDPKRELLVGLGTATLYSLAIVLLVSSGIIPSPMPDHP